MVRTQIQLTEEQARILKQLANDRGISVAELIRQSINRFIQNTPQPTTEEIRERALAIIGAFSSEEADLSVDHDRYLVEIYSGESR